MQMCKVQARRRDRDIVVILQISPEQFVEMRVDGELGMVSRCSREVWNRNCHKIGVAFSSSAKATRRRRLRDARAPAWTEE
jgi:hypothetical protein